VALGLAHVDHDAHGALKLTAASRGVLRGEQQVQMRRAVVRRQEGGVRRTASASSPASAGLSSEDQTLLHRLKAWRSAQARSQSVPAYVILHDATLAEIARLRPANLNLLAGVSGIGARKLERYGRELLAIVADA
jgi:ATP-dependent DNA helicase RecQ